MDDKSKASLGLMVTYIIWGSSTIMGKLALRDMGPLYLIVLSYTMGGVVLALTSLDKIRQLNRKIVVYGILAGVVLTIANVLYTIGLVYTTAVKTSLFASLKVAFIPVLSLLFVKEIMRSKDILNIFAALIGAVLINFTGLTFVFNLGDLLSVLSCIFYSLQFIIIGGYAKGIDGSVITVLELLFVGLTTLPAALFVENFPVHFTTIGLIGLFSYGLLNCALAYYLQTYAMKHVSSALAGLLSAITPISGIVVSFIVLGEKLSWLGLAGSFLIILAIANSKVDILSKVFKKRKLIEGSDNEL